MMGVKRGYAKGGKIGGWKIESAGGVPGEAGVKGIVSVERSHEKRKWQSGRTKEAWKIPWAS